MGLVIGQRIKLQHGTYSLCIFDKDQKKTEQISDVMAARNNVGLVNESDCVIIAVKPQDFKEVLLEIKECIKGKLIVSIAAAVTTVQIEKYLGKVSVVRVMPNIPARIGQGITCLCKGRFASEQELQFTIKLFSTLGATLIFKESLMNAATAISGSGPGFFYDLLIRDNVEVKKRDELEKFGNEFFNPEMKKAAISVGFSRQQAQTLVAAVTSGSIALLEATRLYPQELLVQITSKGGTTEAGLAALHESGSLIGAVKAAKRRADILSKIIKRELN